MFWLFEFVPLLNFGCSPGHLWEKAISKKHKTRRHRHVHIEAGGGRRNDNINIFSEDIDVFHGMVVYGTL